MRSFFAAGLALSGGRRGTSGRSGPCPQRQITGANLSFGRLKPWWARGRQDPLGLVAEVSFHSGFSALRDESGPRETDQSPAERIRVPQDGSGPRETDQGHAERIRVPQDGSGPRWTNQGPARRIRASLDGSGPHRMNTDEKPRRTDQGPYDDSRTKGPTG